MSIPTCKLCKTPGLPGAKFCGACGISYGEAAARAAARDAGGGDLFGASAAAGGDADLDDLFSSLPDAPGQSAGAATQLFMDAVSDDASPTGDLDDLFTSGGPAGGGSRAVTSDFADIDDTGGGEEVGELDDLFGPDLASLGAGGASARPRPQAPGMVTNILQSDADGQDLGNLFGGGAVDPDQLFAPTGHTGLQGAVTAATLHAVGRAADTDMGDLFASDAGSPRLSAPAPMPGLSSGDELEDLFASAPPEIPGAAGDDLDDIFAASGPGDDGDFFGSGAPDAAEESMDDLFASGTGGLPAVSSTGGMDDLFASGSAPAAGRGDLDDLFASGGGAGLDGPTTTGPIVDSSAGMGGDLDDLFDTLDPSAADLSLDDMNPSPRPTTDNLHTVDLAADALFAGEGPTGGGEFDDLFGSVEVEPDVSMPQFAAPRAGPGAAGTGAGTIDVSASLGDIPPRAPAADQLDDLFAAPPSDEPSVDSIDGPQAGPYGSLAGLPSDEVAADQVQSLLAESEDNVPGVPGLEAGDLLAEAHQVADAGGHRTYDDPPVTYDFDDDEPAAPRPQDRRQARRKPRFYALPPEPGRLAKAARVGGLLASSTLLAAALRMHPQGASIPLAVLAPCVALAGGVAALFVYATTKMKLPMAVLSRGLALAAVGLVGGQVIPAALGAGAEAWPMLLALAFAVGTVLELDVLFLSLRLSLAIVGVYSSMSLVTGLVHQTPYDELVVRRVLDAPGLVEHIPPDQVALALKAFDPLFVAANFFLPAVLVLTVLQALRDMTRRWWGLALTRLATATVAGLAVYWNLQQYQRLDVVNLLRLAGLK